MALVKRTLETHLDQRPGSRYSGPVAWYFVLRGRPTAGLLDSGGRPASGPNLAVERKRPVTDYDDMAGNANVFRLFENDQKSGPRTKNHFEHKTWVIFSVRKILKTFGGRG